MNTSQLPQHTLCWINGQRCHPNNAHISVFDHGLLYGDGIFEGIRFYHHKPCLLDQHLARLTQSAAHIGLSIPYTHAQLTQAIGELCQDTTFHSGYIRLVVTRGEGSLGLDPDKCGTANTIIIAAELDMLPSTASATGISTIIAQTQRVSTKALNSRTKSLNYLNNIQAKREANAAHVDEAILLNSDGNVAEATAENLFMVQQGTLVTPPTTDGALEGITRGTLLSLANSVKIPTQIRSIPASSLFTADEVFLCGTGASVIPVRRINDHAIAQCPGPIFQQLKQSYDEFVAGA